MKIITIYKNNGVVVNDPNSPHQAVIDNGENVVQTLEGTDNNIKRFFPNYQPYQKENGKDVITRKGKKPPKQSK